MRTGLASIATDLVGTLRALAGLPAVDRAVAGRAAEVAQAVANEGIGARVERHGPGDYEVVASEAGLFAREFGSPNAPPDPIVAPILDRLARRPR